MRTAICVLAIACAVPAFAHHGKDFMLVESYELPEPRTFYFFTAEQWSHGEFRDQPALLAGITTHVAGEVHVHIEDGSAEAVATAVRFALAERGAWRAGLSAEYELGHGEALNVILAHAVRDGAVVFNIGIEHEEGGGNRATYAIGIRPDLENRFSWGVEVQGRLAHGEEQQAIAGFYAQPADRITLKLGAGTTLGAGKPAAVVRTGLVIRF